MDDLCEGDLVGRFVLQRPLGEGGMGAVFLARDPELQRDIAVKLLRGGAGGTDSTAAQARMLREAQAMAMVTHPNLVAIYEVGVFQDHVFLAMEYVVGETLDSWVRPGRPLEKVVDVFEQAGRALQAIHDAGLVHRDFKPANVMVTADGVAKVLDLGIARKVQTDAEKELLKRTIDETLSQRDEPLFGEGDSVPPNTGRDAFEGKLTMDGALVGTPSYMAPEQLLAEDVSPQTDQFACGIALFEALTGRRPFSGKNHVQVMANIVSGQRRRWPEDKDIPEGVRGAIERALSSDAKARFESMTAFLAACRDGLGLRGSLELLTERWISHGRESEFLLPSGNRLSEGLTLLRERPDSLTAEQAEFILESARGARTRRIRRRALVGGIATLGIGMVPALSLLHRRNQQLQEATRAEVLALMSGVQQRIAPLMQQAEDYVQLVYMQRRAWEPQLSQLLATSASEVPPLEADMLNDLGRLNDYFRPLITQEPTISSIQVAREDDFTVLFFADPDAPSLDPPYEFYNRVVWRPHFGDSTFEGFWGAPSDGAAPRGRFLRVGEADTRGRPWKKYVPTQRRWYRAAVDAPRGAFVWTEPYLFFTTLDAGVTSAVHWEAQGKRHVLAVDYMLTDLSRITAELSNDEFSAAIVTREGHVLGLPRGPRFDSPEKVRAFFRAFNEEIAAREGMDAEARMPTPTEAQLPLLAAAVDGCQVEEGAFRFAFGGKSLWAGRAPVGPSVLGLSVFVVQFPGAAS